MAKKLPEYNASSLADIAFMLLIFFLVTTTMDVDSGLQRKLPPMPEDNTQENAQDINERNIFEVLVNRNNQLLVEGQIMPITQLRAATKEFLENPTNSSDLADKEEKEIPLLGVIPVTKGVISLRNDVGTSYGTYLSVQNELAAAINELRDQYAKEKFGVVYEKLKAQEREAIRKQMPQRISEAEPKKVGGK